MRSLRTTCLAGLLAFLAPVSASDEDIPPGVVEAVSLMVPGLSPESIRTSPLPGLYEVVFGPHVIYVSGDGRFMVRGDVVELATRTNLTEGRRNAARAAAIEKLSEDTMIVFGPEKVRHTVTVFTDVDCAYCAKLHREIPALNDNGVRVRYLAFPRAGIPSENYDRMVSVWCAADTREAITMAKLGRRIEPKTCANPVKDHYAMGQLVGVNGTPTLIFDDGRVFPGYLPAEQLLQVLDVGPG